MTDQEAVVGKWVFDPDRGTNVHPEVLPSLRRCTCEFCADGTFRELPLEVRGPYRYANGRVEAVIETVFGLKGTHGAFAMVFSPDRSSLTRTDDAGQTQVFARADSDRGRELLEAAFRKPTRISREGITNLLIDVLNQELRRSDIRRETVIGSAGVKIGWWRKNRAFVRFEKRLKEEFRVYPLLVQTESKPSETIGEIAARYYENSVDG